MTQMNLIAIILALAFLSCDPEIAVTTITENTDGTWTMTMGNASLTINPSDGAKDISLKINGTEFLTGKEVRKQYYGSSLWLAPQKKYWPQPDPLDYGNYKVEKTNHGLIFKSEMDSKTGFGYTKYIFPDPADKSFIHRYSIRNISDTLKSFAAWEVTRHPKTGLSVFPEGDSTVPGTRYLDPSIPMLKSDGMVWHSYDPSQKNHPGKGSKANFDVKNGWVAYILGKHALVKIFPDVSPARMVPGELDVEIYVDRQYDYIEIETLSELVELAPGESFDWQVEWRMLEIPESLEIRPGNKKLAGFIKKNIR
jgi:hypothetical protein